MLLLDVTTAAVAAVTLNLMEINPFEPNSHSISRMRKL